MKPAIRASVKTAMRCVCCAAIALLLPACSFLDPAKDTTRFAVLASVDELPGGGEATRPIEGAASSPKVTRVGLGPITIPDYLLHSEIVTRRGGTHLVPSATERWGEPFDRALARVLGIDLERKVGTGRIVHYPWYQTDRPDVQVQIAFARCEREETGKVVVAARWSVRGLAEGGGTVERESRIERPAAAADGASTALALSLALAELCDEIAQACLSQDHAAAPR